MANFLLALGGYGLFFLLLGAIYFFLLPSLTSCLNGGLTEGTYTYGGECQKPLIRLVLSITQTPDLQNKHFSFVSKAKVLLLDGYIDEGQMERA